MAELYDLQNDPDKTISLINEERYQSLVEELGEDLDLRTRGAIPGAGDVMPLEEGIKGELSDEKIR